MNNMDSRITDGDAVTLSGTTWVGLVTTVDYGQGLAWVKWPDMCGLSRCNNIAHLVKIAPAHEVMAALQSIAPVQIQSPLEYAFLSRSNAATQIVDSDEIQPRRVEYRPKAPKAMIAR